MDLMADGERLHLFTVQEKREELFHGTSTTLCLFSIGYRLDLQVGKQRNFFQL